MSIGDIIKEALTSIEKASTLQQVQELHVKYLGRKGVVTALLRDLAKIAPKERAAEGQKLNTARKSIQQAIEQSKVRLNLSVVSSEAERDDLDITAPAGIPYGHRHPVDMILEDVIKLFWQLGFSVADGPEVETDWYCFDALNIPPDHPARDMQDTFYLENGTLPRTHTSTVQIRYMENHQPPIRIIAPGKVYRNEDEDATHLWMFNQLEGLVVDEGVSIGDLKGTLLTMMQGLLGSDSEIRLRQNYFPYTEPSVEVDARSGGFALESEYRGEWLELLGAGMVHPKVLANVGIDPERYTGFAFGLGLERLAAIKYGISDIREFWRPNLKFLEQF